MKVTGRHMDITPALRRHIRSRVERLQRYDVKIDRVEFVLSVSKLQHMAEAVCVINGKRFQAKTSTGEMYGTIDQVIDRLVAQVRKYKEKLKTYKGRKRIPLSSPRPLSASGNEGVKVVRPKIPTLSRTEAKDQLDGNPGAMMIFTCADSGKLQILRRMENGAVVLIDT